MAGNYIKTTGYKVAGRAKTEREYNVHNLSGMYIGQVVNNSDSLNTGRITVRISDFGGKETERVCLLATPFGGYTPILESGDDEKQFGSEGETDNGAPKSYGMWSQPPDIGTNVVVMFTPSMEQGVYMGSLIAKDRNYMMGGNASGSAYLDGQTTLSPTSEKNAYDTNDADTRPANPEKFSTLIEQGTAGDFVRGHSQSSARRESPSKVFGITTLGGHTLTLDDGNGSSQNIRIRTKGGAQILLDDSNGFINVINQNGSAWFELDAEGRVDMYSQGGVSIHTEGDYNVHAKGSINMQADQGVNLKSTGSEGLKLESSVGSIDMYSAIDTNIEAAANHHVKVSGNYIQTAGRIDMNGPAANSATLATIQAQTANQNVLTSIAGRVPEHQPWLGNSSVEESFTPGKGNVS